MNIPRSKNTGERGYKHMNIFLVLKTLHVDLHRGLCHENNEMQFSDRQLHLSDRQ